LLFGWIGEHGVYDFNDLGTLEKTARNIATVIGDKGMGYRICAHSWNIVSNCKYNREEGSLLYLLSTEFNKKELRYLQPLPRHSTFTFLGAISQYTLGDDDTSLFPRLESVRDAFLECFSIRMMQLCWPWSSFTTHILILSSTSSRQMICILSFSPCGSTARSRPDVGPKGGSTPRLLRDNRIRRSHTSWASRAKPSCSRRSIASPIR